MSWKVCFLNRYFSNRVCHTCTHGPIVHVHLFHIDLSVLVDFTGTGYFPLLPDGLLSGGGLVLLQLPKNLSLDHQHLQVGFLLLFQGPSAPSRIHSVSKLRDLHSNCEFAGDRGVYPLRGGLVAWHGEAFEPDWGASSREPGMEHRLSPVECPAGCWQPSSHCGRGKALNRQGLGGISGSF